MPQQSFAHIGHEALKLIYDDKFKDITLNITMKVKETVIISDEWAFARTTTHGTKSLNAPGITTVEGNQELFVMQKVGGKWFIARYCFCSTNPPSR